MRMIFKKKLLWMNNLQNYDFNSSKHGDHEPKTFVSYLRVNTTSWGITVFGVWPCVTGCWVSDVSGPIPCLETTGTIYTVTERHIPEDLMSRPHLCGSPKVRMLRFHDGNQSSGAVRENVVCFTNCRKRSGENTGIVNATAGVSYRVETALKGWASWLLYKNIYL
jgi:hypothetical protein